MKDPTLRKVRARGLVAIRYHAGGYHSQHRHGWIVKDTGGGTMTIRLIGDEHNTRLSAADARFVTLL